MHYEKKKEKRAQSFDVINSKKPGKIPSFKSAEVIKI